MLIEFSVANFRSILDKQTLSMAAGTSREVQGKYSFASGHRAVPNVLRAAGIFGPNASGKSSIVRALGFMRDFVIDSAINSQQGEEIDVSSFLFDSNSIDEPSEFEIVFISEGTRYQYGFRVDRERVWEEWLFAVPNNGRTQRWFHRLYDVDIGETEWYINQSIKGEKEIWKKSTRDNALFLSSAVQLRAEVFQDVFSWFRKRLRVITSGQRLSEFHTGVRCKNQETKEKILRFLNFADMHIVDIAAKEHEWSEDMIPGNVPGDIRSAISRQMAGSKLLEISVGHKNDRGEIVYLDFAEESDGTQALFSLTGPWLDVLENGWIVVVDELSNSLHPYAFQYMVNLFHDTNVNSLNGQLIFTSHDTTIMSGRQLHHDQIFLIERDNRQATRITPLSDFKVRQNEAIQKGYLGGRYGALPNIREFTK